MAERPARLGLGVVAGLLLLGLSVGSWFIRASYAAGDPPAVEPADVPEEHRDRLRIVEGIPVVRLSGTPYEMGYQHGKILDKQIRHLYYEYFEKMVVPLVGGQSGLKKWAEKVKPFIPPHLLEEMRGLADAMGRSFEEALYANVSIDRFQSLLCSTVVASGDATGDGEIYFGRNLDFPGRGMLHRMSVVIVFEPKGGEPFVSVTWPGLIGVLSGMNARGVCGATMLIHARRPVEPGMPYMLMYREALARAKRTADVAAYIEKARRTCPNNFMVVDATGAAEVVEWTPQKVLRRPATRGVVCSTNHFKSEGLDGISGWPGGRDRYATLAEFLEREHGRIDAARVQEALADVAKPWMTNVQSMVFLPARREIRMSARKRLPVAKGPFVTLDRAALFGGE